MNYDIARAIVARINDHIVCLPGVTHAAMGMLANMPGYTVKLYNDTPGGACVATIRTPQEFTAYANRSN